MGSFNKQKAFGQHFLQDTSVIQTIVDEVFKKETASILLEIGPGKGALTFPILERLKPHQKLVVAERDRTLISFWKNEKRIEFILEGDFLDHPSETFAPWAPVMVVSNLPYSAGTAIVVKLSEMKDKISGMVLMFQAEVAKRIYAEPSTPDRGSLSLYLQNEWNIEKIISVKPEAFRPPPKVMSEVIRLTPRKEAMIPLQKSGDRAKWNDLLKTSFKQRRKMLKGNFKGTAWQNAFERSGVDPTLRAESLEWKDWIAIWNSKE